jgi:hypothetical protein
VQINSSDEDGISVSTNISIIPVRAGYFVIPAFLLRTQEGDLLHVQPMKLHVIGHADTATQESPPQVDIPATNAATVSPAPSRQGPVVMPPTSTAPQAPSGPPDPAAAANSTDTGPTLPREPDGTPAKVFIIISPQTTQAYVGQSIPMKIQFFIRMDVAAPQNSLPTIKGSSFLMNNIITSGSQSVGLLENEQYLCETWTTAISAPKSGDFPLLMERDTYWLKAPSDSADDPLSSFASRPNLAHEMVASNQLVMHVHALPTEGRPANFTGAIGQFTITGAVDPAAVSVGEPVLLHFTIAGEGNFDYVRCPSLAADPAWKAYVPTSHTDFQDESRTQATKAFEQPVIPQKGGTLSLPQASFSYFDPATAQYVTTPIDLPVISVSGAALAASPSGSTTTRGTTVAASPPIADELSPNRGQIGALRAGLTPVYRHRWFWLAQLALLLATSLGVLAVLLRPRLFRPRSGATGDALRHQTLQQEERAMAAAVQEDDAFAFFMAARHSIQLRLASQWQVNPEAITFAEIRRRDPDLASSVEPFFRAADEVIYSGEATPDLDLAQWQEQVRKELLQPIAP